MTKYDVLVLRSVLQKYLVYIAAREKTVADSSRYLVCESSLTLCFPDILEGCCNWKGKSGLTTIHHHDERYSYRIISFVEPTRAPEDDCLLHGPAYGAH